MVCRVKGSQGTDPRGQLPSAVTVPATEMGTRPGGRDALEWGQSRDACQPHRHLQTADRGHGAQGREEQGGKGADATAQGV